MAETRDQLNAKVQPATKALLLRYCQDKHTTQSEVVEAALLAFLQPKEGDDLALVMLERLREIAAKQEDLEHGVTALVPLLTTIVDRLEAPQAEPALPIARYAQMYDELRPEPPAVVEDTPVEVSQPLAPSWWDRLFAKRRPA